jgi:transposase InsO family protein
MARTRNGSLTSPTWNAEGWLYVAVVIDLFSRRVVDWSMMDAMTAQMVTDGPALRSLYCYSDGVCGRGAAITYLSYNASFYSKE